MLHAHAVSRTVLVFNFVIPFRGMTLRAKLGELYARGIGREAICALDFAIRNVIFAHGVLLLYNSIA